MTKHKTKNAGGSTSAKSSTKVYRSMNEIRRAFYPKASSERSALRGSARTKNGTLGRSAKTGGAL